MDRTSTGNAVIDRILHGGFPSPSINIVMGAPGTGKTIFAQQLAFAAAASGSRPALYLTTVSEPLAKVLTYLQECTFADPLAIGTQVIYESFAEVLIADPEKLIDSLAELIQRYRPGVIIIDSFKAIADLVPERATWRRILFGLAGLLTAYDAATFWVGEYTPDVVSVLPEFAVADGIIELSRYQEGARDNRYLRVLKLRGSDFLSGSHFFRVGPAGLEVFVRLITPRTPHDYQPARERLASGVEGLDQLIETGWLRGTSTIVCGPSGSGKTSLGLHFLREGVARGEPGLLVSFQESPVQLARTLVAFDWAPGELLGPDRLDVLYTSPVELQLDSIVTEIFWRIETNGVHRVVIDALGDMARTASDDGRYRDYIYSLNQYLTSRGVTSMLTLEGTDTYESIGASGQAIVPMSDNVLILGMRLETDLVRTIRVVKSRGSAHDGTRRRLHITRKGLAVDTGVSS